jgi:hypothetical protein
MSNYVPACPHCGADASDIGWSSSYFEIFRCSECGEEYCCKCRNSNNGRQCPECGDEEGHHPAVAQVSKG